MHAQGQRRIVWLSVRRQLRKEDRARILDRCKGDRDRRYLRRAHGQRRRVCKAVVGQPLALGAVLQAAQRALGRAVPGPGQIGVAPHAFKGLPPAVPPYKMRDQHLGGAAVRAGQGNAVPRLKRRVAGHRHSGRGVVKLLQHRKQMLSDLRAYLGQALLGQRHLGDRHGQVAVLLVSCRIPAIGCLDAQRRIVAAQI